MSSEYQCYSKCLEPPKHVVYFHFLKATSIHECGGMTSNVLWLKRRARTPLLVFFQIFNNDRKPFVKIFKSPKLSTNLEQNCFVLYGHILIHRFIRSSCWSTGAVEEVQTWQQSLWQQTSHEVKRCRLKACSVWSRIMTWLDYSFDYNYFCFERSLTVPQQHYLWNLKDIIND